MMTEGRVNAVRLFRSRQYSELAALGANTSFTEQDVEWLSHMLGDGGSVEPWRTWADSADVGEALYAIALVLANDGEDRIAVRLLSEAERLGQDGAVELGEILARLGEWDKALPYLREVVAARSPMWRLASFRLGEHAFVSEGRSDEEVLSALREGIAESDEAAPLLARVHQARGELNEALAILKAAIDTNDSVPIVLGNLMLNEFADRAAAEDAYRQGIDRGDPHSAYNLALLLEDDPERQDEIVRLLQVAANGGDTKAVAWLGELGLSSQSDQTPR